jgi:hypothetical protein
MIHAEFTKPRVFPWNSARAPEQINRLTEISDSVNRNMEEEFEIGRVGKMGFHKKTPSVSYPLTQNECGDMSFFRALANVANPETGDDSFIDLDDLKKSKVEISTYLTDADGIFRGTSYFPKMRVSNFSLDIGDPDAKIARKFTVVGEDYKILDGEYLAFVTGTVVTPGDYSLLLSPDAVAYKSGKYVFDVLRVRSGIVSELLEDTTSTYDDNSWRYDVATKSVIVQDCLADDIIKVFYMSATPYTTIWTDDDSFPKSIYADQVDILLKVGAGAYTKTYKLQSVSIDATLNREDKKEIGNKEVVQTNVKSKKVSVKLGQLPDGFTLEEILRGSSAYPYIDARDLAEDVSLVIKIYETNDKETFLMGYQINNLTATTMDGKAAIEEFNTTDNTLESDNLVISDEETDLE